MAINDKEAKELKIIELLNKLKDLENNNKNLNKLIIEHKNCIENLENDVKKLKITNDQISLKETENMKLYNQIKI